MSHSAAHEPLQTIVESVLAAASLARPGGSRRAAVPRFAWLFAFCLLSCADGETPQESTFATKYQAQVLEVLDAEIALDILLPDVVDPSLDGLEPTANAAVVGMWSPVFDWPINGLHSVLLPTGRVLTYGTPSGRPATQDGRTLDIWDPTLGFLPAAHNTDYDAQRANSFCSSAAFTAQGSLLLSGGNSPLESSLFSPETESVEESPFLLASERWYASMITLPDGRFLIMGGSDPYAALRAYQNPVAAINSGAVAMTPEIYEPDTGFRSLLGAYSREAFGPDHHRYWYPRAWVAPSGEVFGISSEKMWYLDYEGEGEVRVAGDFKTAANATTKPNIGPTSTAVMFAPGRILQVGGNGYHDGHETPGSALATIIDINGEAPVVTETNAMHHARQWPNATLLPDGKVIVTGGTGYSNNGGIDAVYEAELWNPESGTWTVGPAAAVIRVYHSAAILLPNGTVLSTGGGAPGPVNNLNAEVYYPPYLFRSDGAGGSELAPRPRAVAVSSLSPTYDAILNVDLAGSSSIQQAVLVAASSTTHSFNTSQRRIVLEHVQEGGRVAVRLPPGGVEAPPGFYELFLFDDQGVPSRGVILALGDSMAPPPADPELPRGAVVTFESANLAGQGLSYSDLGVGTLESVEGGDAVRVRFILKDGLADATCISFESFSEPGKYLRQEDYRIHVAADEGSDEYEADATFCPELGLSGTGFSFRSVRFPDRVLRHDGLELWIDEPTAEAEFPGDATYLLRSLPLPVVPPISAPSVAMGAAATYTLDPAIPGAVYSWDFGDGSEASSESPSPEVVHEYEEPGLHLVTLTVRLADGRRVIKTFVQAVNVAAVGGQSRSSSRVAISGRNLWVVNPDNDSVSVVDVDSLTLLAEVPVGASPQAVAVSADGSAWVVSRDAAALSVVEPDTFEVVETYSLPPGSRPHGLVFSPAFDRAYVSLDGLGSVVQLDTTTGELVATLDVGPNPRGMALTGDGTRLLVSRFVSPPVPGESSAAPQTALGQAEVRIIDLPWTDEPRVMPLAHSNVGDSSVSGRGLPNYLGAPVISPDGKVAWIPSKQDNIARGTLRDGLDLDFQNTVRAVISRIDLAGETEEISRRLDLDNSSLATAAVMQGGGVYMFVALQTSREVAVVNALTSTELFRIEVGRAPSALTLSEDGGVLFVENFMDRSVSAIDLSPLLSHGEFRSELLATVATVRSEKLSSDVLVGKQLFYDAKDTRLARDGYLSCAVCHADGADDGRVWDLGGFGEGVRNTISLLGFSQGTRRLHWTANFDEVQDFEGQIRSLSAGTGLLSDLQFEAGSVSEPLGDPKAGLSPDLDALAAYVKSLSEVPPSPWREGDALSKLGVLGRKTFAQKECNACHYGANFSDDAEISLRDIGTIHAASGQRLFGPLTGIDVPALVGVWSTAPYLHDGSALTLSDAVLAHEGVSVDEDELNQLVAFLEQLDDREPPLPPLGCEDGARNGNETGVDCGGDCASCPVKEPPDEPPESERPPKTPTESEEPEEDPLGVGGAFDYSDVGGSHDLGGDSGKPDDDAATDPPTPEGCSCRAAGQGPAGSPWRVGLCLMAAFLVLLRRRRRDCQAPVPEANLLGGLHRGRF